jgi:hypothetical protein
MRSKAPKSATARVGKRRPQQYTVRDVPPMVDASLRKKAKSEGKSLNRFLREALEREAGLQSSDEATVHHDLDHLAGRWEPDPQFDAAIAAQDAVDDELWR